MSSFVDTQRGLLCLHPDTGPCLPIVTPGKHDSLAWVVAIVEQAVGIRGTLEADTAALAIPGRDTHPGIATEMSAAIEVIVAGTYRAGATKLVTASNTT